MNFIEVCSGCGGLSKGFMECGFSPILLNEIDRVCCSTLRLNHPGVCVECNDMNDLNLREYKGLVDVLIGGPPCQAFSHAGLRKGLDDTRGDLIMKFGDLVDQCEPRVFLIENVRGLLNHDKGKTLATVLEKLNKNGLYKVSYKLLNAVDYSVPQKRERVIIVGVRRDITKEYVFPNPCGTKLVLRDVLTGCPISEGYKYPAKKKEIMQLVPPGGCWVDLPENIQKEYMGNSLKSGGGKRGIARRLSMDEPSLTLTTSPCQKQTERCHPIETRPLTVREYARIQTFPDTFLFCGSIAQQYKQIGNAVPVTLAYHLAKSIEAVLRI
jgi:DNA (cytosine-5)-methyltransferase 1